MKEYTIVIPVPMNCIVKASSPEEAANKLLFSFDDNESDIYCETGSVSDLCDCVGDTICVYGEDGSEHIVYVDSENYKVLNKENE